MRTLILFVAVGEMQRHGLGMAHRRSGIVDGSCWVGVSNGRTVAG